MLTFNRVLLLATILTWTSTADAGMRCSNGKLANKRDTMGEVLHKCGAPDSKRRFGRVVVDKQLVSLERWTYVPQKGRFIKYLDFHNGVLREISNGARVRE